MQMAHGNTTELFTVEGLRQAIGPWALKSLRENKGCSGGCDEVFEHFMGHPKWMCNSVPELYAGGSWIGHIFPGVIFFIWATHWLIGFLRQYFGCLKRGDVYTSRGYYALFILPEPLESAIKFVLPMINMCLEVWLAHASGYKRLYCAPGTSRPWHLDSSSLGNWQHAFMYPGFIISGLTDLLGMRWKVPVGTQQVFLSLTFAAEALLFGLHKKHTPMDIIIHELLTYATCSCAVFCALEAAWVHNPLLTAGRIASLYLQSIWFFVSARVIFEGHTPWDLMKDRDIAPVMFIPIVFVKMAILVSACMLAAFLLAYVLYRPQRTAKLTDSSPSDADAHHHHHQNHQHQHQYNHQSHVLGASTGVHVSSTGSGFRV